jgi:hypothetical protein
MTALIQLCNPHHEEEGKNQKAKTVNMKKGRKRGEGVWLGVVSGVGTPDRDSVRKRSDISLYVVDSIAWLYHQRVMNAPPEHVGSVARELMGRLELQTKTLINYARDSGASIIFTSWSSSKAKKAFEEHQRREMEKEAKKRNSGC